MNGQEFSLQEKLDSSFLFTFIRSQIRYSDSKDAALVEAYRAGIYDATVSFLGESHLRITGMCTTVQDLKKFLRQISFNAELDLYVHNTDLIRTVNDQELLAEYWFKRKNEYTQLILMIPK